MVFLPPPEPPEPVFEAWLPYIPEPAKSVSNPEPRVILYWGGVVNAIILQLASNLEWATEYSNQGGLK